MNEPIKRSGHLVYKFPEGCSLFRLKASTGYAFLCTHPDRAPWLVTWDGIEVPISELPFQPVADEAGKG